MVFWIHADRDLIGSRSENGFVEYRALQEWLDRRGLFDPIHRDTAEQMFAAIANGRSSGLALDIKPERAKSKK